MPNFPRLKLWVSRCSCGDIPLGGVSNGSGAAVLGGGDFTRTSHASITIFEYRHHFGTESSGRMLVPKSPCGMVMSPLTAAPRVGYLSSRCPGTTRRIAHGIASNPLLGRTRSGIGHVRRVK